MISIKEKSGDGLTLGFGVNLNAERLKIGALLLLGGAGVFVTLLLLLTGAQWATWFIFPLPLGCLFLFIGVRKGMCPLNVECRLDRETGTAHFVYCRPLQRIPCTEDAPLSQFVGTEVIKRARQVDPVDPTEADSIAGTIVSMAAGAVVSGILAVITKPSWQVLLLKRGGGTRHLTSLTARDEALQLAHMLRNVLPLLTGAEEASGFCSGPMGAATTGSWKV